LLLRLRTKVRNELRLHQDLTMLLGSMDMLMSACEVSHLKANYASEDDHVSANATTAKAPGAAAISADN
ncbi:hypothetical protein LPJ56_004167, partial [Coemansia sp. RSA 2599]